MPDNKGRTIVVPPPPYSARLFNGPPHGSFVLCSEAIQQHPCEVDFSFGLLDLGRGPFPELSFEQKWSDFRRSVVVSTIGRFDPVCDPDLFHFMARFAFHGRMEAMRKDYNWLVVGCYNPNKRVGECKIFSLESIIRSQEQFINAMFSMVNIRSVNGLLAIDRNTEEM
jgi:hypothetical protein